MYESNQTPLPDGAASKVFAKQLAELQQDAGEVNPAPLTADSVVRWGDKRHRPIFTGMCRRLLLPGSEIRGLDQLRQLVQLADQGESCLLCLNHRSNLDVPTLDALLTDHGAGSLSDQLIWIAGRKLEEESGLTNLLVRCFNRVLVTPHTWFDANRSEEEIHQGKLINVAAERSVLKLRTEGWVFALFPSGTRMRPGDESTKHAIAETDSYLKAFDHLLLCHISGCTLPVSQDHDFVHETPRLDQMVYSFGTVQRTDDWRSRIAEKYPGLDQRAASAQGIEDEIDALGET